MSFSFWKMLTPRNSVVVKDEFQFGDSDAVKVRIERTIAGPHHIFTCLLLFSVPVDG